MKLHVLVCKWKHNKAWSKYWIIYSNWTKFSLLAICFSILVAYFLKSEISVQRLCLDHWIDKTPLNSRRQLSCTSYNSKSRFSSHPIHPTARHYQDGNIPSIVISLRSSRNRTMICNLICVTSILIINSNYSRATVNDTTHILSQQRCVQKKKPLQEDVCDGVLHWPYGCTQLCNQIIVILPPKSFTCHHIASV